MAELTAEQRLVVERIKAAAKVSRARIAADERLNGKFASSREAALAHGLSHTSVCNAVTKLRKERRGT